MKTGPRDRIAEQVSAVETGQANAGIDLLRSGGGTIVAILPHGSVDNPGLKHGVPAVAHGGNRSEASSVIHGVKT